MKDIIKDAQEKRFKPSNDPERKEGILITEDWLKELTAHPYHSSKYFIFTYAEKPGTGIFLMRERSKLYKSQSNKNEFVLSKRLQDEEVKEGEHIQAKPAPDKRMKGADGKAIPVPNVQRVPQQQNQ